MRRSFKLIIVIVTFILLALVSLSVFQLPAPQPQTADNSVFSAERAIKHVEVIASKIHTIGTPEQAAAREYIINELTALGLKPEVQQGHVENDEKTIFNYVPYNGEATNIYVRLEGSGNTNQDILMLAHYDSTLGGPGAGDDASSCAVLLETARALLSEKPLINDIIILFADGEEADRLGSTLFVKNSDLLGNVKMVLNFESRGNRGPSIMFEVSDGNEWMMKEFQKAVTNPVTYSFGTDVVKIAPNVTDFTPFLDAGKSGMNFSNLGGFQSYHLPSDTPENLSQSFLQHHGEYALSLARHFGGTSLDSVKSKQNAVFFTLARNVMVVYSTKWTIPLTILALVLFVIVLVVGIRKQLLSLKEILSGFLASLLVLATASVFGFMAQTVFASLFYKLDNIKTISELLTFKEGIILKSNIWIVVSIIMTAILIYFLYRRFAKKRTGVNQLFGSLVTWIILTIFAAFALPGTGYMFLWPLLLTLIGLIIDFIVVRQTILNCLVTFILCAGMSILIFIPVVYTLFEVTLMMGAVLPIAILSLPAYLLITTASMVVCDGKTKSPLRDSTRQ